MNETPLLNPDMLHTISIEKKDPREQNFGDNSQILLDGKLLTGVTSLTYTRDAINPVPEITIKLYAKFRSDP